MTHLWDYDQKKLKKSKEGKIKILERMINFGIYLSDKKKLPIKLIKKYWLKLKIDHGRRRFLKFILWKK
jgi:hypothetical protein